MGLSFSCAGTNYGAITSTDCPVSINTTTFIDLPGSDSVGQFQLLSLKSNGAMTLRIGAAEASLIAVGGSYPTGFSGGQAFGFSIDQVAVTGTFLVGDQSISQVVTRLNQAAISAGLTYLPFTADVTGQVRITGKQTGLDGLILVTVTNATIGFVANAAAEGEGSDLTVNGLFMAQFDTITAPKRILIKGNGQVEILAAGSAPS
jgi:hypothetical protein